jgi:hypothetical protein
LDDSSVRRIAPTSRLALSVAMEHSHL